MKTVTAEPIILRREYVELAGSVSGAVMLAAMVSIQEQQGHEVWWEKTRDEWTAETGLTRREQETARGQLVLCGLLEEKAAGIPKRLFFRLDLVALWRVVEAR